VVKALIIDFIAFNSHAASYVRHFDKAYVQGKMFVWILGEIDIYLTVYLAEGGFFL
jgi:hypothetical protein